MATAITQANAVTAAMTLVTLLVSRFIAELR
jgi:hypothetical protein